MIVDARRARDALAADYDLCIVGAGAAGISLALELEGTGLRICLLEAGGERPERTVQRLFEGVAADGCYPPLRDTRLGALGGSTGVWAGWCRPLDELDFEPRPRLSSPGWPFARAELLPYYRRAHELCGLGELEYDAALWAERLGHRPLLEDDGIIANAIFFVCAQRFGARYRERLERSNNVDLVLHAPATRCFLDRSMGRVKDLGVRTLNGRRLVARARCFVLAAGGIENARLLLLSADSNDPAPGNEHDLVGRYFTDHPFVDLGALRIDGSPRSLDYYFPQPVRNAGRCAVRGVLTLDPRALAAHDLPNAALFFHPRYASHPAFATPEVTGLLESWNKLRSKAVPGGAAAGLALAVRGPRAIGVAMLRKLLVRDGPSRYWRLRAMFDVEFRHDNRVTLGAVGDALGRPRARVEWRLGERDLARMRQTAGLFNAAIERAGIGRIEPGLADEPAAWRRAVEAGKHHMGTTRMHPDPRQGVVDEHSKVHGTTNLYVAGSSVFPAGGFANPTLTIVALAIRLAERMKRVLSDSAGREAL